MEKLQHGRPAVDRERLAGVDRILEHMLYGRLNHHKRLLLQSINFLGGMPLISTKGQKGPQQERERKHQNIRNHPGAHRFIDFGTAFFGIHQDIPSFPVRIILFYYCPKRSVWIAY